MSLLRLLSASAVLVLVSACASQTGDEPTGDSSDEIRVTRSFVARGTAYYPANNALEGGTVDRKGVKLRTLQQFLAGQASYVSVAMDANAFKYGQRLRIKELEAKYGRSIVFRVVDTGGAFRGKGTSRIDVCVASLKASSDSTINGTLHIDAIDETSGPAEQPADDPADDPAPAPAPAPSTGSSSGSSNGGGASCSSDGACNPGNDGSGLICVSGQCVPGCRSNAQCPGNTMCHSGQCS